jgi:hypothetical protein
MKILQMGKLKGNTIKGVGVLDQTREQGKPSTPPVSYTKENDKIQGEYPFQDNTLYSTFHFTHPGNLTQVISLFKNNLDSFLSVHPVQQ